jgi:hypothetical protein
VWPPGAATVQPQELWGSCATCDARADHRGEAKARDVVEASGKGVSSWSQRSGQDTSDGVCGDDGANGVDERCTCFVSPDFGWLPGSSRQQGPWLLTRPPAVSASVRSTLGPLLPGGTLVPGDRQQFWLRHYRRNFLRLQGANANGACLLLACISGASLASAAPLAGESHGQSDMHLVRLPPAALKMHFGRALGADEQIGSVWCLA